MPPSPCSFTLHSVQAAFPRYASSSLANNEFDDTNNWIDMRAPLLFTAAVFLATSHATAQINAGDVPPGASVYEPNINLILNNPFTTDSAGIDINCDDAVDLWAILMRGEPAADAPNDALLRVVDTSTELCTDAAVNNWRPQYYGVGQPLACTGAFDWRVEALHELGDFGGFTAIIGPATLDSMYVAYRVGNNIGWILLSFNLGGGQVVELNIHKVVNLCGATSVEDQAAGSDFSLFPNPCTDEVFRVQTSEPLRSIEMLGAAGKLLARYSGNIRSIAAPDESGTYLVRVVRADGQVINRRLVRY